MLSVRSQKAVRRLQKEENVFTTVKSDKKHLNQKIQKQKKRVMIFFILQRWWSIAEMLQQLSQWFEYQYLPGLV